MEQTSEQPNCNCNKNEHNKDEGPNAKERYELLIRARNFHYENYNKWMTYFYVATSALFVSYFTVLTAKELFGNRQFIEYSILSLGFIVSLFWYWSSKGYYFWNINFINLVGYYETDIFNWRDSERVYKVLANKNYENQYYNPIRGANISTSKVAILFAFIITYYWGTLLCNKFLDLPNCKSLETLIIILLPAIAIITISSIVAPLMLKSNIKGMSDLQINHELPYGKNSHK